MKNEIRSIIINLQCVLNGEPWYGRPVYALLGEIDPESVKIKPTESAHSLIELLYHMLTWAEFTLKSLEKAGPDTIVAIEKMDWPEINSPDHSWQKGLAGFKLAHEKIIELLKQKDDTFLSELVNHREFNYRFLLNGLIQHNIYHLGQIAYIKKMLN